MLRVLRRCAEAALLAVVLLAAGASSASAHATLTASTPADSSTLESAPASITLTFHEPLVPGSASVTLRSGQGDLVAGFGTPVIDPQQVTSGGGSDVVVSLPALSTGSYAVTWQVRSADDLHASTGTLVFGVGRAVAPGITDRPGPVPDLASAVLAWLDLLAIALLVGAMMVALTVAPRSGLDPYARQRLDKVCLRIASGAAWSAVAVGLVILLEASGGLSQLGSALGSSPYGRLWLLREVSLIALALLAGGAVRSGRLTSRIGLGTLVLTASLAAIAGAGHVGLGSGRGVAVVLLTVHLLAGAGWAGGLLLVAVLPRLLRRTGIIIRDRSILRAFGPPAMVCVAVGVTSGLALTGRQVASLDALLTTTYGRVLMTKVMLVSAAGLLGLRASVRLRRQRTPARPSQVAIWLECAVLAAVLLAAAALSLGAPPRGAAFAPTVHAQQPKLAAQVSDLFETVDVTPNTVGQSWLRVTVDQTRRPVPSPVTGVSVSLISPTGQSSAARDLTPSELANHWELPALKLTAAGTWRLAIAVHRSALSDVVWEPNWTVSGGPLGADPPLVSDRPWSLLLDGLAAIVVAVLSLLAAQGARRRRRLVSADQGAALLEPPPPTESEHPILAGVSRR